MKVCVVGSGGREHALAVVLGRDAEVVVTPGNPGIPGSVDRDPEEIDADLFVIGPEAPLVGGLADRLRERGRLVFGPGADGARLEGSKAWMKELLVEAGVPTAAHGTFTEVAPALGFLDTMTPPFVVKTDGLAAGKGVVVTDSLTEARNAVEDYLSGTAFGDAGRTLVIEEGLVGAELSVLAVCDGTDTVLLPEAQDFKRALDGDLGPNTGGMGAYSPVPLVDDQLLETVRTEFVLPTLAILRARGIDYRGVLYAGLMLTPTGPKLLEYNVRFGDPETQVVLPRLTSSLTDLLASAAAGQLDPSVTCTGDAMVTVVCASEGYPRSPRTGDRIDGLEAARAVEGVEVFCAGVSADSAGADSGGADAGGAGALFTAGGRVLDVTGRGANLQQARERAMRAVAEISWPGMQHRSDIAAAAVGERP
ncbi:MAG: phosphoribosylamine--glycine ligase [Microthrixaceae bacterium]|nr:phosphoribosylamine--glycine ligase [Microthrixaceae bacterium]